MDHKKCMERKAYNAIAEWMENPERKALLVRGCRQIGKTYIIREFLEREYEWYMEINMETDVSKRSLFKDKDLSASAIIDRLMFDARDAKRPVKGRSAIFLDEIQACPEAYTSLKALADDGRYDIIASGSLLGVLLEDLQNQSPLGYINTLDMYPMDFEEFLWAVGIGKEDTEYIARCIRERKRMDTYILSRVSELYRRYMVVGGMPAAVSDYVAKFDYTSTRKVLKDIVELIGQDSQRYSKGVQRVRIDACMRSIPDQLSKENKKFKYVDIEKKKGSGKAIYGPALVWLCKAGMAYMCNNLTEPVSPLRERTCENIFKIYMADTGLLLALNEESIEGTIVNRDPYANNGMVVENAVACALKSRGYVLRYYSKTNSTLEVDFIINMNGIVTAVESKSGRRRRSKSLQTIYTKTRTLRRAIKLGEGNIFIDENGVEHYPLFAPCFFENASKIDLEPPNYLEELKDRFKYLHE